MPKKALNRSPKPNVIKGICWAAGASTMWGISGTLLQFISQTEAVPATWFLSVRTIIAGLLLLILSACLYGKHVFDVFRDKVSLMWIAAYGIFGIGANLLTFYMSIQTGNSAASSILQYLAPLFIVLGTLIFKHRKPMASDLLVFVIALIGVVLSITKGNFSQLSIPAVSLLWGIGSGITAALYVVLPRKAVAHHSPFVVLGWGTLLSGILFNLKQPVWVGAPKLKAGIVIGIGAMILIGTIFPFSMLLHAIHFAPSEVVSLVDAIQPVMTLILSIIFFHIKFTMVQVLGAVIVIIAIYLLQYFHRKVETAS